MRLSLLIATRGRPKRFRNAVDSALRTARNPFHLMAYVDEDDPKKDEYEGVTVGPSVGSSKALLSMIARVETPYFMIGADDIEFRTQDWDEKLLNAMPRDDLAIVYGTDHAKQNCNHFVMSMKWVRLIGPWPDIFTHFGPDGWVSEVAKKCGRLIQVKDVEVEHLHFKYGKCESDETYQRARVNGAGAKAMKLLADTSHIQQQHADIIREAIARGS